MVNTPFTQEKIPTPLENFMRQAILEITGEEITLVDVSPSSNLLSCISQKIAMQTGLDSCDVARWILASVKEYWMITEMNRNFETQIPETS